MKQTLILALSLWMTSIIGWAQPHTVVGYTPASNTLTALHYGSGNVLEKITVAGQTQTTIVVNSNGQPKRISNEFATLDYTFAGTSKVTVTQTVNGETKTSVVPMNSDQVLKHRKDFADQTGILKGASKADDYLRNGGAKLVGDILTKINDAIPNPINICFQQALNAAKNTKNPIIPIDHLEALVEASELVDKAKAKAIDYIFNQYPEWTDKWSDFVYNAMMEVDGIQNAANKKKSEDRLALAQQLLSDGANPNDIAKLIGEITNNGTAQPANNTSPTTNASASKTSNTPNTNTTTTTSASSTPVSRNKLETTYFYFDNPDGTIESYPEYTYKSLSNRMMSISSSKYATPFKLEPQGAIKKYEKLVRLLFARQTRTAVFVFDGQESAKAAMMTTTIYSSTLLGLWAAVEDALREQVGKALDDAHISHTTSATWRDAIKQDKPEELTFNGHEGGRIVNRIDMSNSLISLLAGANVELVFDMYFYYDEEYDKMVGVVFSYSETSNPKNKYEAAAYGAIKAISAAAGCYDPTTGQTTMASAYERRDMIDYFKKHFHIKKTGTKTNPPEKCPTEFKGTATEPTLIFCGDTITYDITEIIGIPPSEIQNPGVNPLVINPVKPQPVNPDPIIKDPIGNQPVDNTVQSGNTDEHRSAKKFAVIKQATTYESIDKPFAENDKYIFFMQPAHMDNAILAVEKQSGALTEFVAGKRKGSRPNIISMGAHAGDLYLDVQDRGVVRYDGKDVNTSEHLFKIDRGFMDNYKQIVVSPNGRYLAYSGLNSKSYVYDLQAKKIIKEFHDGCEFFLVTDDGDFYGANNFRVLLYQNDGNTDGDANKYSETQDLLKGNPVAMRQIGNDIYLVGGNKVVKTPVKGFNWTESATLAGNRLQLLGAALSTGNKSFAYVRDNDLNRFAHFTQDSNTPTLLKKLSTGINVGKPAPLTVENAQNLHIDQNGNIWMIEESGSYLVVIYNPNGIVGLTNIAGKFIKR